MITTGNQFNDDLSVRFIKFNFRFEKYLLETGRTIRKFLGLVGLYIVMLGLLVTLISPVMYLILRRHRKRMERDAARIVDYIPDASRRQLVEMHLFVERFRNKWRPDITREAIPRVPGIIRFLIVEIYRYHDALEELESTLFRAAYPDVDKAPAVDELSYMEDQVKDYEEDLRDPSLDEYEEYYLKK